jgi:hypothetical protein
VFVTVVRIDLPARSTFDVEVEIAPIAPVKEASTARNFHNKHDNNIAFSDLAPGE